MTNKVFLSRFTPSRTDPEVLERIFVQREALAADIVERIHESAVSGNMHHVLLVGPRGSGKSHFVSLAFHRVFARADLRDRLRIAWLAEDETTTSFLKLLLRIHRALGQRYPGEFADDILERLHALDDGGRETWLERHLIEHLHGRTLLVIVENLDEIFKGLGDEGQKRWRAFQNEHPVAATLATSQQLFAGVSLRASPFYGQFQIEHLKPLNLEEAVLLLKKIAVETGDRELTAFLETPAGRGRVRALHHLSGGNHRIYIVLSDFLNRAALDELVGPFQKMLDELTPYYQERLRWLSPQQREIVEFLCKCQTPVPVKEMVERLFIAHQTATSQLKDLREKRYVESTAVGREARYELAEPLMRLCIEVKENNRQPMRLIVEFLRIWHDRKELTHLLESLSPDCPLEREYVLHALKATDDTGSDDPRLAPILRDMTAFGEAEDWPRLVETLEELAELRGQGVDWFTLGYFYAALNRQKEALEAFDRALKIDPDYADAWYYRGGALMNLGNYKKALESFDRALQINPEKVDYWNNRGVILGKYLDRDVEALEAWDRALNINPDEAGIWNNRGIILRKLGRHEEALEAYDRALRINPDYADAWNNRGVILGANLDRNNEALEALNLSLKINPDHVNAWNNRGNVLENLGRHEESLEAYDRALKIDPSDPKTYYNCVLPMFALNRWEQGFQAMEECLKKQPPASGFPYGYDIERRLHLVLTSTSQPAIWKERLNRLLDFYTNTQLLTSLGTALVRSLQALLAESPGTEVLAAWLGVWREVASGHEELRIPLRIFEIGIRYLQTGDRREFHNLLKEERAVLIEALGLDEEKPDPP